MAGTNLGERIQRARKLAGLTQRELAALSGVSFSLISKLEQGERQDARLETVRKIAAALHVSTTRLVASGPENGPTEETTDRWLPVRRALVTDDAPDLPEEPTPEGVRQALDGALTLNSHARYTELTEVLPALIRDARVVTDLDPAERELHTHVMLVVGSVLVQHRQFDTAEQLLDQTLGYTESTPQRATAVSTWCWSLLRRGRLAEAREKAVYWADELEPRRLTRASPADLAGWGWLLLRAAAAASRDNRDGEARTALRYAKAAATAIGTGERRVKGDPLRKVFGSPTIARKQAEHATITDRPDQVLALAASIPSNSTNDHRRHLLDVAHAQERMRQHTEAVETLWKLQQEAPEWLAQQRYAKETLDRLVRKRRTLTPEMRALARVVQLPL
ncbi:helix-turn-helix domain-containing protein [Streptomyces alkaliphilus]|uniref:Helix-turn-helix domain-containing protein n=1 Tax=Streptomyces alkaliphilus TaxID=1472722 RepID=A0A7W3Y043_9ACTN|nr:helix-turn-helix transcriptional regulator [Streptomyces alkaliphilus]MBB0243204.1 helix-turn-helix domain-containing protein [Streptomyces alkaliphilus]